MLYGGQQNRFWISLISFLILLSCQATWQVVQASTVLPYFYNLSNLGQSQRSNWTCVKLLLSLEKKTGYTIRITDTSDAV